MALAAAALAALSAAMAGCGSDDRPSADYAAQAERACPGTTAGAQALQGPNPSAAAVIAHVKRAERIATDAAKALDHLRAPSDRAEHQDAVVRSLLAQAIRLRLVREQIARGYSAQVVLDAARAGLTGGDRQAADRLTALGVHGCRR